MAPDFVVPILYFLQISLVLTSPSLLIRNETKALDLPPIQLFNLKSDTAESTNVYSSNPDKVKELYRLLESYVENGRSTPGPKQSNEEDTPIDPAGFAALKSELNL